MKYIFSFLIALISLSGCSKSVLKSPGYSIVSDEATNDLQPGKVKVIGTVLDSNGKVMNNVLISSMDSKTQVKTDTYGTYEIILSHLDTSLYIYKKNYKEIAIKKYDFKEGHTVTINFFPVKIVPEQDIDPIPEVAYKPVIYLYSSTPKLVNIALTVKGELTFSYPAYAESWNVRVNKDGVFNSETNKKYPYLFWEGEINNLNYTKENNEIVGEIVETDTIIPFLENKLNQLGLNRKEQTDFITFWAPKIKKENYAFIQFLVDDEYSSEIAGITINPTPESMRRIYLLFTPFKEKPTFKTTAQIIKPFNRNGFTVIEWGGSELEVVNYN